LSGKFLQRSLFAAVGPILVAIVTSHTHRNVKIHPRYGKLLKEYSSLFSLCCLKITIQLRSGTVDKMDGIFAKRIWQQ